MSVLNRNVPDHIKTAIKEIADKENIRNYNISITAGSNKGDNYIGIIDRIVLNGIRNDTHIKLNLICKIAPENIARREQFQVRESFEREFLMYEKILPVFTKIQEKLPEHERFRSHIKCYKIIKEEFKETLIMEDLKEEKFQMWNRQKPLDLIHTKLLLKELGKFHATSFVIKDQNPEIFKEFSQLKDVVFNDREAVEKQTPYFDFFVDRARNTLSDEENIAKEKMKFLKENYIQIMFDGVSGKLAEPYAVICHGDCWSNNMLFKYEDNIATSMCFLDWQIGRYASPITDLCYFFFCCTDKYFRDQYFAELLKFYHDSIRDHITSLGSDPNKLFPYSALEMHLKKFTSFALGLALYDLPNYLSNVEDIENLDEVTEETESDENKELKIFDGLTEETAPIYNQRISDVIRDCIRLKYI